MRLYWNLYLSAKGEVCTITSAYLPAMYDDEFAVMETFTMNEIMLLDKYRDLMLELKLIKEGEGYRDERSQLLTKLEKQIKQKVRDQW